MTWWIYLILVLVTFFVAVFDFCLKVKIPYKNYTSCKKVFLFPGYILKILIILSCFVTIMIKGLKDPKEINLISSWYSISYVLYIFFFISRLKLFELRFSRFPPIELLFSKIGLFVRVIENILEELLSFLPLIILLYIGFLISFNARSDFTEHFKEVLALDIMKLFMMNLAQFKLEEMGLGKELRWENDANYLLLFLFVVTITIIMFNMLTSIAFSELDSMFKNAKIKINEDKLEYIMKMGEMKNEKMKNCRYIQSLDEALSNRYEPFDSLCEWINFILCCCKNRSRSDSANGTSANEMEQLNP